MPANPPHSFGYASGLPPQSDRKIYANLQDCFISDSLEIVRLLDLGEGDGTTFLAGLFRRKTDEDGL